MKKIKFCLTRGGGYKFFLLLVVFLTFTAVLMCCKNSSGGGGSSSSSGEQLVDPKSGATVEGTTITTAVTGSEALNLRTTNLKIKKIWMCDHEVTQHEYQSVMQKNPSKFSNSPAGNEKQENRPVECVSWYDAIIYCNKRSIQENLEPCYTIKQNGTTVTDYSNPPTAAANAWTVECDWTKKGYRLPTEVEWEYAARGGKEHLTDNYTYAGSNTLSAVAWNKNGAGADNKTHSVKQKKANALGLYDMTGNVQEWCWDIYDETSKKIDENTPSTGVTTGNSHVMRGGSWSSDNDHIKIANRAWELAWLYEKHDGTGFRVCRSLE